MCFPAIEHEQHRRCIMYSNIIYDNNIMHTCPHTHTSHYSLSLARWLCPMSAPHTDRTALSNYWIIDGWLNVCVCAPRVCSCLTALNAHDIPSHAHKHHFHRINVRVVCAFMRAARARAARRRVPGHKQCAAYVNRMCV